MTGGTPFGLGFGLGTMPMPGPVDGDPGQMQLDDEQRRLIAQRLLGTQMFHPGNNPSVMSALADQDQDQGQGPAPGGGQGAPSQAPSGPTFDSPLAAALRGAPSMLGGQMTAPQMPAAPQQDGPQQDTPTLPAGIPSMIGAAFPQMGQASGPEATGAIPQQPPQIATARPPQATAQATAQPTGGDDDDAAPADAQAAPAARTVPLPPQRPSQLTSLADAVAPSAGSFDPLTGQPVSGSPQPVRGEFDPLTGQPVSGSPRPMGASSSPGPQGGPQGAPGPAAGGGQNDQSFVKAWQRLADSGIGDQLLAMSAGAFQGRTLGESLGKGLQNMLAVKQAAGSGDMQKLEYALKVQKAQQEQTTLTGNANYVKAIFAKNGQQISDQQALTLGGNPTIMNDMLKGIMPPSETYAQETDKNGDTWQTNTHTGQRSLLKAADKDDVQLITDPVTGTVRAVRKSEVFGDKGGGSGGGGQAGGAGTGDGTEGNVRTVFEGNKGLTPLTNPTARLKAGIRQNDDRAAWMGPDGKVTFEPTPPSTTINMPPAEKSEQSAIGTARASVVKEHIEAGRAARDKIQILDQMRGALDAAGPNMMTGPLGEPVLRAKQALGGVLGTQLPGTSATEMFANSGPVLAGAAARAITSRPAQIEFTTMLNAKPGLMNSPEGNRASMDVMRQSAVRDADLSDIAARSGSVDEFIRKRDEYEHAHPMINPFTGKPFGSATPAGPTPLGNQGAAAPTLSDLQAEARRRNLIR